MNIIQRQLDRALCSNYLSYVRNLNPELLDHFPDFMVISPGRTGTTWLAENLRLHPEIFIPEKKEVKYFDSRWGSYDINWYLDHFKSGLGKTKGDVSPPYGMLPEKAIRAIQILKPDLKLIFLMRDPLDRAWSVTKMTHKYKVCNFRRYNDGFKSVSEQTLVENFALDAAILSGDYLSCLKRWLNYFPKEQFFLGFYEDIFNSPKAVLEEMLGFLNVSRQVSWAKFVLSEKILPSTEDVISERLQRVLRNMYKKKTKELCVFLKEHFPTTNIPQSWDRTLLGEIGGAVIIESDYKGFIICQNDGVFYGIRNSTRNESDEMNINDADFSANSALKLKYLIDHGACTNVQQRLAINRNFNARDFDDYCLTVVLAQSPYFIESYRGYNLIGYANDTYAIAHEVGDLEIPELKYEKWAELMETGKCIIADSLKDAKRWIDLYALAVNSASVARLVQ